MKVAVSMLKSKFDESETIAKINDTNADYIHLDVMDGAFVPNTTPKREHLHESNKKLQVHLMVSRPYSYITEYALKNTESIIIQYELDDDIKEILKYIRKLGFKCGIAIKPETNVHKLANLLDIVDYVLVLTVNPGMGGQKMMENVLYKIDLLKDLREDLNYNYQIIVDGGVNDETIDKVTNADIIVSGSYICMNDSYQKQIDNLLKK